MVKCNLCDAKGIIRQHETGRPICKDCFFLSFENKIHRTITEAKLFRPGQRIAIAASGGKDSTVLAYLIKLLNERHGYGLDLVLLSVDEGITGYRDDSLASVQRNQQQYSIPLSIVSYGELYGGWTMDRIVEKIGRKNNCTFCGVLRRQALDRGAVKLAVEQIVTGHNADDIAETVLMNLLRGDIARLPRSTDIITGTLPAHNACGASSGEQQQQQEDELARVIRSKPFKWAYEKEIVMYAYFRRLDYFSTECLYSPNAYRGFAREFIKDLETIRPRAVLNIIKSGETFGIMEQVKRKEMQTCERCGYIASNALCKACILLDSLNGSNTCSIVHPSDANGRHV